ncbi:hypothetical protein SUGI_0899790 [Cryptomeria japonica]|nr:hypothetical protein SUGI_0899790 [Cryptomeria japonica]
MEQFKHTEMCKDRVSGAPEAVQKRKAMEDTDDMGFLPTLKPIITDRHTSKARLSYTQDSMADLNLTRTCFEDNEHHNNCNDNEGCETPKSEKHQIPKILSCPGAPRKPRPTVKKCKRSEEFFYISPVELNLLFSLSKPTQFDFR